MVTNTCGEQEPERRSRRWNVLEGVGVMTLLLAVLWLFGYPFGVLMRLDIIEQICQALMFAALFYLLFVSPRVHGDTAASWGLGSPWALARLWRKTRGPGRVTLAGAMAAVVAGLALAFYLQWPEAADFMFNMKRAAAERMQEQAGGKAAIIAGGFGLSVFFATCVLRYDNFLSAFLTALKVNVVLGVVLYGAALLVMGRSAFDGFQASVFGWDVFRYVFWGAIQQLLFSSYFGTRLRKGFAPGPPGRTGRRRLGVAVLNGAFFGIIHISSWPLVVGTWILGVILSWVFMEDRNRNLIALGFIHGFLGSSLGFLFSSGKAGAVEIETAVGPWHMDGFDGVTMAVTTLIIVCFSAFLAYAWRNWREA